MVTTRRTGAARGATRGATKATKAGGDVRTVRRRAPAARARALPADQLVAGVLDVKKAVDQTLARFSARIDAQLGEVLRSLEGDSPASERAVKEVVGRIRELKVKPEKGRLKDIVRLHDLAEELVALLPGR